MFENRYSLEDFYYGNEPSPHLRHIPNCAVGLALDIGCGEGRDSPFIASKGYKVIGVDIERIGLLKMFSRRGIIACCATVRNLPFADGTFDLINGTTVLDHLSYNDGVAAVEEILRVAGGGAVVAMEVFTVEDPGSTDVGEISETAAAVGYYFAHGELAQRFECSSIFHYEEVLEWDYSHGAPHQHGVARLVGRLP